MRPRSLNIVSLDVPYPPDYGGTIDIFYKIKALHRQGIDVYLHCFEYGKGDQKELNHYCKEVYYYQRKTGILSNFSFLPYITYSRRNAQLISNLNSNQFPILFEGLHTVYPLLRGKLQDRRIVLRSHNIEHHYYRYLANRETNLVRKLYFYKEAFLLKRLLQRIPGDTPIAAISPADTSYLRTRFTNTFWLPPFHSSDQLEINAGSGDYALYHGNLSVSENTEVVENLLAAFANQDVQLVIAGKAPTSKVVTCAALASNIRLVSDPDEGSMHRLIQGAHVLLLLTYQPTGIKLKLLESLYRGRFCLANRTMVANTGLETIVVPDEGSVYEITKDLMKKTFTDADIAARRETLLLHYDNTANANLLIDKLFSAP